MTMLGGYLANAQPGFDWRSFAALRMTITGFTVPKGTNNFLLEILRCAQDDNAGRTSGKRTAWLRLEILRCAQDDNNWIHGPKGHKQFSARDPSLRSG